MIELYRTTPSSQIVASHHQSSSSFWSVSTTPRSSACMPAAHMERSYADFLGLQTQLRHRIHVAHGMFPCEFCRSVTSALAMLMWTEDDLVDIFTAFISELLVLCKTRYISRRGGPCLAQERVPEILCDFLFQD